MRRLKSLWLLTAGVTLAAGVTPVATAARETATPVIAWTTCDDPGLRAAGAECGMLSVPLDYAKPDGTQIKLALSRIKHTVPDSQAQGVMLINAGGPGVPGVPLSPLGGAVPNGGGGYYDWIGFDPRGVGQSEPSLSCDPQYFDFNRPSYVPLSTSVLDQWFARSRGYAEDCRKNGPILSHITTIDSARDLESIRVALGASQLNYYGFSYGTYLGQVYSTMFPSRVRRMVLDSNVDPRNVWYQANLNQDVAFNTIIEMFFGWLASHDDVYHLGSSKQAVRKLFYETEARLTRHPADGKIGGDEWVDIFLNAGYHQGVWTLLGDAFAGYVHHNDAATLENLFLLTGSLGNDNFYAVYNAVQCTDIQWPREWSTWSRDNWATFARAPFETWGNAWYNAPCLYWPAPAHKPVTVDGSKIRSALLIDQTLDGPTPYEGSLEVRRRFPHASLIALPGGTEHGSSLSGISCLDDQIASYLVNGTLPPRKPGNGADTTCAPPPLPVPGALMASESLVGNDSPIGNSLHTTVR